MTTTKEDQIRDEFESLLPTTIYMDEHAYGMRRHKSNGTYIDASVQILWDGYKACADSYEKKLAMLEAEVLRLDAGWQEANQRALKYGLEIAEEIATGTKCAQAVSKYLAERTTINQQLSEANARNARLVESAKQATLDLWEAQCNDALSTLNEAISANSEAVAAWEVEKLAELDKV